MQLFNLLPGLGFIKDSIWEAFALFDIGQMFTPPKSKSPWEAMTVGSTGGAFKWANNPVVKTAAALAAGAVNPALGAAVGASQFYPGYKKPVLEQIGKTALGATLGYAGGKGMQALGTKGGFQSAYDFMGNIGSKTATASALATGSTPGAPGSSLLTQSGGSLNFAKSGLPGAEGAGYSFGGGGAGGGAGLSRMIGPALAIGSGVASFGKKPPTATFGTPAENFESARTMMAEKYLGEAGAALPRATREQYLDLVTMPLGEMSETFRNLIKPQLDETTRGINEQFDTRDEEIDAQFAQAGGTGSSDHLRAKTEARQFRTQETRRARFEIEANGLREQINVKLDAMARGLQAGQFDTNIAMELAGLQGKQDEMIATIEQGNYDQFQQLMSQLFQAGLYESFIGQRLEKIGQGLENLA